MTREETNLTHTKHTSTRRETTFHGNSVYRSVRHEHIFITNSFCGVHKSRLSSFIWAVWLSGLSLPYATTQTHTLAIHTNRASYQTQAGSYFGFLYHIFFLHRVLHAEQRKCRSIDLVRKVQYLALAILDVMCFVPFFSFFFIVFATRSCLFAMLRFIYTFVVLFFIEQITRKTDQSEEKRNFNERHKHTKIQKHMNVCLINQRNT